MTETHNERILQLVIEHFPVVTIDRQLKGISVPFVGTDKRVRFPGTRPRIPAARLEKGCRKISFVRPEAHETMTLMDRQYGFQLAFNDYGLIAEEALSRLPDPALPQSLPETMGNDPKQDIAIVDRSLREHEDIEAFMASEYNLAKILKYCLEKAGRYKEDMREIVCFAPDGCGTIPGGSRIDPCGPGRGNHRQGVSMELLLKTIHGEERPGTVMAPYES